uniref:Uncharacterized protein n=1 Tax=Knipowitschia caucasica TaxID=637954 RepID=A0AAV2JDQ5_KNICA
MTQIVLKTTIMKFLRINKKPSRRLHSLLICMPKLSYQARAKSFISTNHRRSFNHFPPPSSY